MIITKLTLSAAAAAWRSRRPGPCQGCRPVSELAGRVAKLRRDVAVLLAQAGES